LRPLRAHDPLAHRIGQIKRIADGEHLFAHLHPVRVAPGQRRQVGSVDLENGHIDQLIRRHHPGAENLLVVQLHLDAREIGNRVLIGQNITVPAQDHARAIGGVIKIGRGMIFRRERQLERHLLPEKTHPRIGGPARDDPHHARQSRIHHPGVFPVDLFEQRHLLRRNQIPRLGPEQLLGLTGNGLRRRTRGSSLRRAKRRRPVATGKHDAKQERG
jgi:hypothetical protein